MVGTDGRLNEGSIKWKRYKMALYALSQNSFRNSSRVSNGMDPDQVGQNVQLRLEFKLFANVTPAGDISRQKIKKI